MTSITFYGGINEIGGNKVLLDDGIDSRIFLDFGESPEAFGQFYDFPFGGPTPTNILRDYLKVGTPPLTPPLKGLYRKDLLRASNLESHDEPLFTAIVVSHAHLDHYKHVALVDHNIPIVCNRPILRAMKASEDISGNYLMRQLTKFKERPKEEPPDPTYMPKKWKPEKYKDVNLEYWRWVVRPEDKRPEMKRRFHLQPEVKFGNILIKGYPIDHCIGAQSFIIYTPETTLAYTGDIRMHGPMKKKTLDFIEVAANERPDYLIIEGTRIDETDNLTEEDVKKESINEILQTSKSVFVDFSFTDIERLSTFREVAKEAGRKLVIPPKHAYFLWYLQPETDYLTRDVGVYKRRKGTGLDIPSDYNAWEKTTFKELEIIEDEQMHKRPQDFLIVVPFSQLSKLIDIDPEPGSLFIQSTIEPWDEEGYVDEGRKKNWYEQWNLMVKRIHSHHHAPQQDIVYMVKRIHPKHLIPIHTKNSQAFQQLFKDLTDVKLVEYGVSYDLTSAERVRKPLPQVQPLLLAQRTLDIAQKIPLTGGVKLEKPKTTKRPKGVKNLEHFFNSKESKI